MTFKEFINHISIRPGMYIGGMKLEYLERYVYGYIFCMVNNNIEDDLIEPYRKYFNYYVQSKVCELANDEIRKKLRYNNGMSFVQLIPFVEKDSIKQVHFYFSTFNEFVADVENNVNLDYLIERCF